ncbi:hypothetical protein BVRB_4g094320 [Beta vulgaris subsp. vulgaris]|nr:hypothetical protein BVRB_4g094320 [Beta vulgaris subsp. vulgaris]
MLVLHLSFTDHELRSTYMLRLFQVTQSFCRSYASASASEPPRKKQTGGKKDISTVEDPFDSPTYHIPEKPVTFTEGASYSIVILAGLE